MNFQLHIGLCFTSILLACQELKGCVLEEFLCEEVKKRCKRAIIIVNLIFCKAIIFIGWMIRVYSSLTLKQVHYVCLSEQREK